MTEAQTITDAYYTPAEAAEILKVSEDTVRRMLKRGELRHRRLGRLIRIPASSLLGTDVIPLR